MEADSAPCVMAFTCFHYLTHLQGESGIGQVCVHMCAAERQISKRGGMMRWRGENGLNKRVFFSNNVTIHPISGTEGLIYVLVSYALLNTIEFMNTAGSAVQPGVSYCKGCGFDSLWTCVYLSCVRVGFLQTCPECVPDSLPVTDGINPHHMIRKDLWYKVNLSTKQTKALVFKAPLLLATLFKMMWLFLKIHPFSALKLKWWQRIFLGFKIERVWFALGCKVN